MHIQDRGRVSWLGGIVIRLLFTALLGVACVLPPPSPVPQHAGAVLPLAASQPPTVEPSTPEPPTATPEPATLTPEPPTAAVASTPQSVANFLDQIFPPDKIREREFVLFNCGNCHSWLRPICAHKTANEWNMTRSVMRDRVPGLSQEDFDTLFNFLAENFNDAKPIPDLPEGLRNEC